MSANIKLSSPATGQFWEIAVLFEDEHLLALDKPAGLAVAADPENPDQPNLTDLLHRAIAEAKPWAVEHGLSFLQPGHRLDCEVSGVLLLARSQPALASLANQFGSAIPRVKYVTVIQGVPAEDQFEIEAKLAPHPTQPGRMHVDSKGGKRSSTRCTVQERFDGWTLIHCEPANARPHQVRVHLRHAGLPAAGDSMYGGRPLLLSRLKPNYHLKPGRFERPLLERATLHVEELSLPHPVTAQPLTIRAPWPKDLSVAVKYLRRWVASAEAGGVGGS